MASDVQNGGGGGKRALHVVLAVALGIHMIFKWGGHPINELELKATLSELIGGIKSRHSLHTSTNLCTQLLLPYFFHHLNSRR